MYFIWRSDFQIFENILLLRDLKSTVEKSERNIFFSIANSQMP